MNQKNYIFLMCCLGMTNVLFTMENCGEPSCFASACQQIQDAFEKNDITLLATPLDFFSDLQENPAESAGVEMQNYASPLLYSIKKIASINAEIANIIFMQQQKTNPLPALNEIAAYNDLLKQKNEHFQVLKMLCISFPIFSLNKWNCEHTTPLLYACSCVTEMTEEVRLLLAYNADPCQEVTGENVRHKFALEPAEALKHKSIVALLKTNNKEKKNDDNVTRGFFTICLTRDQLLKKHRKLAKTIEYSNYEQFKKRINQDYIDVNFMYHDQQYGSLCFLAIALNNYFLQRELFFKIIPEAKNSPSLLLQKRIANGYNAAQGIVFDIIEKKAHLDIDYKFSPTIEDIKNQDFSTPLKEAIKYNTRSLIAELLKNGADIYFKGNLDDSKPTPLELASQISPEMLNFITKLSLQPQDEKAVQLKEDDEVTE